jgi:hypothetical protein
VAQQLPQDADVRAILEQMRRKGVPEGMTGGTLGDARRPHRIPDCSLRDRLVQMVASHLAAPFVHVRPRGLEHPLPGPQSPLAGQVVVQCVRQLDSATTLVEVGPLLCAYQLLCAREQVAQPHRLPAPLAKRAAAYRKLHPRNAPPSELSQRRKRLSMYESSPFSPLVDVAGGRITEMAG